MLLVAFLWPSGVSVAAQPAPVRVMVLGDSITAGLGISTEDSLPAQLKWRMIADGYSVDVINAGISGDTTAKGLARLDADLSSAGPVDLVIIELGLNDMLHGRQPNEVRANLETIIATLQAKGVTLLLTAVVSDDNYRQDRQKFDSIYPALAEKYRLTLVPFILDGICIIDGVWGNAALCTDEVHPNAAGVAEIIKKIAPYVEKALPLPTAKKAQ